MEGYLYFRRWYSPFQWFFEFVVVVLMNCFSGIELCVFEFEGVGVLL